VRGLLDRLEEWVSASCLAAATLIVVADVLQRWSAGADWLWDLTSRVNLSWAQEAAIFLAIWSAKFGAAYGVRTGIHIGVDALVNALRPRARRALVAVALLLGALFTFVVVVLGARWVAFIYGTGQVSYDLELPLWIAYSCIPLGSGLMCYRFLEALWRFLRTGALPGSRAEARA
jgi:C4-dicarboxylate transporter DctQ subunit